MTLADDLKKTIANSRRIADMIEAVGGILVDERSNIGGRPTMSEYIIQRDNEYATIRYSDFSDTAPLWMRVYKVYPVQRVLKAGQPYWVPLDIQAL